MAQQAPSTGGSARTLTMARAGREAVIAEMRKDPNIFVIGEDVAKLGDTEFLAVQDAQNPQAGGIGETSQPAEHQIGLFELRFHPSIRIIRYIIRRPRQYRIIHV